MWFFLSAFILTGEGNCTYSFSSDKSQCQGAYEFQMNDFFARMKEWNSSADLLKAYSLTFQLSGDIQGLAEMAKVSIATGAMEFSGSVHLSLPMGTFTTEALSRMPDETLSTSHPVHWTYEDMEISAGGMIFHPQKQHILFSSPIQWHIKDFSLKVEKLELQNSLLVLDHPALSHPSLKFHSKKGTYDMTEKTGFFEEITEILLLGNPAQAEKVEMNLSVSPPSILLKGKVKVILTQIPQ